MLAKLNWSLSKVGSKFGQSWVKVQAKLNRSSSEVGSNLDRIWIECQLRSNFERNGLNFEQSRTRVAKEPNVLCIGAHIALQVGKRQSILWESYDNVQRVQMAEDRLWHDGHKAPTIARILVQESLPASRQGVKKFLKKYIESMSRQILEQITADEIIQYKTFRSEDLISCTKLKERTRLYRATTGGKVRTGWHNKMRMT